MYYVFIDKNTYPFQNMNVIVIIQAENLIPQNSDSYYCYTCLTPTNYYALLGTNSNEVIYE